MIDMQEKFLTIEEIGELLRVEPELIARLCRTKKIRGIKVGGQWRVRESDLEKFIQDQLDSSQEEEN